MKVGELMTADPVCCAQWESAASAAKMMQVLDVGVIPIVESDKSYRLVGIVTDRDLCMSVVAKGLDPSLVSLDQCMSELLICCNPGDELNYALDLMKSNKIRRLPVVDDQFRIQGIVSTADIALYSDVAPEMINLTIKEISKQELDMGIDIHKLGASYAPAHDTPTS